MANTMIDKNALMNAIFLGKELPEQQGLHPGAEMITRLDPALLIDFHSNELGRQPYQVRENEDLKKLIDSVAERGVFEPIIVRPDPVETEKFEILAGHRRRLAALHAGKADIPSVIMNLDDDEANIIVCDANLHREDIRPSEKAWAYRIKLTARAKQGKRTDLTCDQVGHKLNNKKSVEVLAEESEDSKTQIQRYIRLTYLLPDLLELVDNEKLKFIIGVELSYLKESEQKILLDVMCCDKIKPSLDQARGLKLMSKEGRNLTADLIHVYLHKDNNPAAGLTTRYINNLLPKAIQKLPAEQKKTYVSVAMEHYADYLQTHPTEASHWETIQNDGEKEFY